MSFFKIDGARYISSFTPFPYHYAENWKLVLVVPENDFLGVIIQTQKDTFYMSMMFLFFGILFAVVLSRSVTRPLQELSVHAAQMGNFDLTAMIDVESNIREIQALSNAMSTMQGQLSQYKRYVPIELVNRLKESGKDISLDGESKHVSLMFTDIQGFSKITMDLPAEVLIKHLSAYMTEMSQIIKQEKGLATNYIGESVLAVFGGVISLENHAVQACLTALKCQEKIGHLNKQWIQEGKTPMLTQIGVHTGDAVIGNMGSVDQYLFTVLGENVHFASQVERSNRHYRTALLISEQTHALVKESFICRPIDYLESKIQRKPVLIYELLCHFQDPRAESYQKFSELFLRGFDLFLERKWRQAEKQFEYAKEWEEKDHVTELFVRKCRAFQENDPGESWKPINLI
ncbi:MAG: adenylate cyclase [Candidatus Marinamargulisbacteria bacterium]